MTPKPIFPGLNQVIQLLGLEPLIPEGGYFKRTYQSKFDLQFKGEVRPSMSAIYYLVTPESFSALHQLTTDEIYHFYAGDPLELHMIAPSGEYRVQVLGMDLASGQVPQVVVPSGYWQCSKQKHNSIGYSLVGTTVSPGFDFADFTLASHEDLLKMKVEIREALAGFVK